MSIIATTPVPPASRLDTAATGEYPQVAEFPSGMMAEIYQLGRNTGERRAQDDIAAAYRRGMVAGAQQLADDGQVVTHPEIGQDRSIEVAFDAGRQYERIVAARNPTRDAYWHGYADALGDLYGTGEPHAVQNPEGADMPGKMKRPTPAEFRTSVRNQTPEMRSAASDLEHPSWCDPAECSFTGESGYHRSKPVRLAPDEYWTLTVSLLQGSAIPGSPRGDVTLVDVHYTTGDFGPGWEALEQGFFLDLDDARTLAGILRNVARLAEQEAGR